MNIIKSLIKLFNKKSGASFVEYAILIGLLTLLVAFVISVLGNRIYVCFSKVTTVIPN